MYVAHFAFFYVWIQAQRAAVTARRATVPNYVANHISYDLTCCLVLIVRRGFFSAASINGRPKSAARNGGQRWWKQKKL